MASNLDVSVIIVNYNTSRLIADCVKSIIELTKDIRYEVLIIDNASEPYFEETISSSIPERYRPFFKFIGLPQNIGFGRANNQGLKLAEGRNIFFLNPDTLLLNNSIKILSDFLDNSPDAGACGGNLFDEDMQPTYSYKRFLPGFFWESNDLLNTFPEKFLYGKNRYFNHTIRNLEVGFITGADLMVKRKALEETGGFRDEYFMYFEETDLCLRLKQRGWKIYNVPEARIQHLESKSFETTGEFQSDFKTSLLEESRNIYHTLNTSSEIYKLLNFIYESFLLSRAKLLPKGKKKEYYKSRLKYFKKRHLTDGK